MTAHGSRGRPTLARKAEALMLREHLFPAGSRALVMVSGGQDSLALLHILASGQVGSAGPESLHVLHVNHHLRGVESDEDEALVIRACGALGVDVSVVHRRIEKARGNVQEAAREARREAARESAARLDCDRIALGHTADDQVETTLYRLGRYGGMGAFAGMRASDPPWVRPLLECRRYETADYCSAHGLDFARDRGNEYPGYARTGIREQVVPAWEAALPGAVEVACRAAEVAAEMRDLAAAVVRAALPGVTVQGGSAADCLSASALLALETPLRRVLLHTWLERRARPAASRAAVLAVESLLAVPGSAERSLAGGLHAVKEYDHVFLVPSAPRAERGKGRAERGEEAPVQASAPVPAPLPLTVPGSVRWLDGVIRVEPAPSFRLPDVSREAFVDAAALSGPLQVRAPRPGDRIRPLGAAGSRKLQDIFVDERVPASQRATWPLVVSGDRVIWVCGLVVSEEGRIGPETKEIVRLMWERM